MENFLCFIHLPKTAGSTFQKILKRNYRTRFKTIPHNFEEGPLHKENIRKFIEQRGLIRAIGSHRITADIPYDDKGYNVIGIAFVRKPVERFISEYYYFKTVKEKNLITKTESFKEFISKVKADPESNHRYINGQMWHIKLGLDVLQEQMDLGKLHLLPTERFDEAMLVLNKLYPKDFPDVSYSKQNVNKKKPRKISEDIKARIEELVREDEKLYQLAEAHLNQLIQSTLSPEELDKGLKRLRRNCKIRTTLIDPMVKGVEKMARVAGGIRLTKVT